VVLTEKVRKMLRDKHQHNKASDYVQYVMQIIRHCAAQPSVITSLLNIELWD